MVCVLGRFTTTVLAAGLYVAGSAAVLAQQPGPGQINGYANSDRTGASKTWELSPDKPYLYIPYVGDDVNGRLADVDTGAEVGVALFQKPFFAARDVGCQYDVGSDSRPDLRWLGATARFVPPPPGAPPAADADGGGYASLILFRSDLGPPPGALLLDRRTTIGLRCANPVQATVYNRIFVPMPEAPNVARCFDLSGAFDGGGTKDIVLDFTTSDRLLLLMPGDMADRYKRIRHDFTATLFDKPACQGKSISFKSAAAASRDTRLGQYDFRDRARSVRIVYEFGNADPLLVRTPAPVPAPAAQAMAEPREPAPGDEPADLPSEPLADPNVGTAATTPAPAPIEAPATTPQTPPRTEAAQAPPPAPAPPAPAPAPAPAPTKAETPTAAAKTQSAATPPAPEKTEAAAAQPARAQPRAVQQAMPKLLPIVPPPAAPRGTAPTGAQTFEFPVYDIYRLNYCLRWGADCGAPAAAAWCKSKGFKRAAGFKIDQNVGALFPTFVMADKRVCAKFVCDAFREITCAP